MSSPGSSIVRVIELCRKKQLVSDGNTSFIYLDVEDDDLASWGPYLSSIQIMTATENRTTNHSWKVVLYWSLDGRQWNGPVDLHAAITATGDVIQSAYTDTSKFGLHLRLALAVANSSGGNPERAVVSAWAVCTFKN